MGQFGLGREYTFARRKRPKLDIPKKLKRFRFTESNPTYVMVDGNGRKYVMRKKPPGKIVSPTAHQVNVVREASTLYNYVLTASLSASTSIKGGP